MSIKEMPAPLRPREKLLERGAQALADAELLAILLRTGAAGRDVLQHAQHLLERFGGLAALLHAPPAELARDTGLGPAKRAELGAVLEVARRAIAQQLRESPVFDAPQKVKDFAALRLGGLPYEVFSVLYLDSQHRLIEWKELFRGTLAQTSVYPREVLRQALLLNAGAVILAHNHPSGHAEPSRADEALTTALVRALQMIDVRVLDHLVVGHGQVVSFAERGLL